MCDLEVFIFFWIEPSLTLSNLSAAVEEVVELDRLSNYLNVPQSKQNEIDNKYTVNTYCKQAILKDFLQNHPAPSWTSIAEFLYHPGLNYGKYHRALQIVKEKYLRSKNFICTNNLQLCVAFWYVCIPNMCFQWNITLTSKYDTVYIRTWLDSSKVHWIMRHYVVTETQYAA